MHTIFVSRCARTFGLALSLSIAIAPVCAQSTVANPNRAVKAGAGCLGMGFGFAVGETPDGPGPTSYPRVTKIAEKGPAEAAGLAVGDTLFTVNGKDAMTTRGVLGGYAAGTVLSIAIHRAGQPMTIRFVVGTVVAEKGSTECVAARPAPTEGERALVASVLNVFQTRDTAKLATLLDPAFHIGPLRGPQANGMMAKLVATRSTPTTSMTLDSVSRTDSSSVLHTTMLGGDQPRYVPITVSKATLISETGLLGYSATGQPPSMMNTQMGSMRVGGAVAGTGMGGAAAALSDTALRRRLIAFQERDQRHRARLVQLLRDTTRTAAASAELDSLRLVQNAIDAENADSVVSILKKAGSWPTFDQVGPEASTAVFLLLQHATPAIQKEYVSMLERAANAGQARKSDLATLVDRLLMFDGKKQKYGSQLKAVQGQLPTVWPIEDEANVDARRREMGLDPLRDYLKRFGIEYRPGGD